jgi:serine/threonine-protein kinase
MSAPVEAGTVLAGKYRVDRVLGEGGMGIVVAATDLQLERRVAIKFLLPEYVQHKEAAQRFLREARAAVKIQSEHVARVIDVGTMDTGAPYMVMEFLEGQDLSGVLADRKTLPPEEAVAYVLEACDAIAEAHSVGIVHRDLKPANLFLARQPDGSSRVKVLDFGISKATMTAGSTDPSLTRTSSMMGSPLYMSPEQMKSAKHVDPRTDVWALGVILYELLHGEPPFYAESIPELSAKVLLEEPVSIRSRRMDVPEALEAIVMKALAKNVDARFPTVADLAIALSPFGPHRTRANVERASRVLRVTGGPLASSSAVAVTAGMGGPPAYAQTAAAWAETGEPSKKAGKKPLLGVAAVAVLVLAGAGAFLATRGAAPAAEPAAAATPAEPPAGVPPAAPAPEAAKPAAPEPQATPQVTATPELAAAASGAPPSSTASQPAVAAQPAARKPAPRVPARPKPAATPAPAPAAPADPFGGFGSRK